MLRLKKIHFAINEPDQPQCLFHLCRRDILVVLTWGRGGFTDSGVRRPTRASTGGDERATINQHGMRIGDDLTPR